MMPVKLAGRTRWRSRPGCTGFGLPGLMSGRHVLVGSRQVAWYIAQKGFPLGLRARSSGLSDPSSGTGRRGDQPVQIAGHVEVDAAGEGFERADRGAAHMQAVMGTQQHRLIGPSVSASIAATSAGRRQADSVGAEACQRCGLPAVMTMAPRCGTSSSSHSPCPAVSASSVSRRLPREVGPSRSVACSRHHEPRRSPAGQVGHPADVGRRA